MPRKAKETTVNTEKNKGGRPRKYETAEALSKAIDSYFDSVDKHNQDNPDGKMFYTWPDMCLFLNVDNDTIATWLNKPDIYKGFSVPVKRAELRMQAELEQMGRREANKTGIVAYLTKQKHYGGYSDKPANDNGTVTVKVDIAGVKGEDAFG